MACCALWVKYQSKIRRRKTQNGSLTLRSSSTQQTVKRAKQGGRQRREGATRGYKRTKKDEIRLPYCRVRDFLKHLSKEKK